MISPEADDPRQRRRLVEQLRRSRVYREYENAFRNCTGLPLSLHSGECFGLAHQGDTSGNPFCAMMGGSNHTCASCLAFQQRLTQASATEPGTCECPAGLIESAVPVRVGEHIVGYLQTGQILLHAPTPARLSQLVRRLKALGVDADYDEFAAAYARSRVLPRQQYEAILQLLTIFAQQLSGLSSQLAIQEERIEQPAITRARAYIAEHHADELTLAVVARVASMSTYHFCKSFHKTTGLTFTDYLARVRVERVRAHLLDPHVRISEAAFAAGFQSLSQFSRVFRRVSGETPTAFRDRQELARSA